MDHDLDTLHGVASAHSDSGYASTQYSAQHPGAPDGPRHPGPASLNSRLDRLTRQMGSLAHSSHRDAGASIGITRKTIACTVHSASEASTRASRVRFRRVEEQDDEDAHEQPHAKRRRSLPPRVTLRSGSTGEGTAGGDAASGYSAPVVLNRVVSPRSGATRVVTSSTAQPHSVETLEGTMQIPSFLLEQQAPPQLPASPPPDWLSSRLLASSRAHDPTPARAAPQAPLSPPPHERDLFQPNYPPGDDYFSYAPAFDPIEPSSSPRPSSSGWLALPFSTDGRLAPTASLASSPPRPRPPDSLYEAQMQRDYHFFDSTPPSQQDRRGPAVGPPFSQAHFFAFRHDPPHAERPSERNTVFGQPVADLGIAHLYDDARASSRRYTLSSSPPRPHPTALGPLSPPLSPAPSALDTFFDDLNAPISSTDFWRPCPRPPVLLAPSPTPGRARYAALLERSAAQQVRHVEAHEPNAQERPLLNGPEHEHEHEHEPGPAVDAMQLEPQPSATPSCSPARRTPTEHDLVLDFAPHGPPPPRLAPITSYATPLARVHPHTRAQERTPTSTLTRQERAELHEAGGKGEAEEEEEEGEVEHEEGEAGRAERGERGGGGAEGGRRDEGERRAAGGGGGRVRAGEEDGWAIWEDDDEIEES